MLSVGIRNQLSCVLALNSFILISFYHSSCSKLLSPLALPGVWLFYSDFVDRNSDFTRNQNVALRATLKLLLNCKAE
jgi:hypothetical protein